SIIERYSAIDDCILNLCSGTGSTTVACIELGNRDCISVENDTNQIRYQINKIDSAMKGSAEINNADDATEESTARENEDKDEESEETSSEDKDDETVEIEEPTAEGREDEETEKEEPSSENQEDDAVEIE